MAVSDNRKWWRFARIPGLISSCALVSLMSQIASTTSALPEIGLNHKSCGIATIELRIVNGLATEIDKFPWLVFLHVSYGATLTRCAGALLTSRHVITAAHCTLLNDSTPTTDIRMAYGSTAFTLGVKLRVKRYIRHESFVLSSFENDLAILVLDHDLKLGPKARVICLPKKPRIIEGQTVAVAGWGVLKENGTGAKTLRYTTQLVWPPEQCRRALSPIGFFYPLQTCAYKKGSDACQGDSGAPMMVKNGKRFEIVGLVSFGNGCNIEGVPGVYTNVFNYLEWIKNAIAGHAGKFVSM